jgi:hypothetical protein
MKVYCCICGEDITEYVKPILDFMIEDGFDVENDEADFFCRDCGKAISSTDEIKKKFEAVTMPCQIIEFPTRK